MLKFRKMRGPLGPPLTVEEDERFTRIGAFSRTPSLTSCPSCERADRAHELRRPPARVSQLRRAPAHRLRPDPPGQARHHRAVAACLRAGGRDPRRPGPVRDYIVRLLPRRPHRRLYVVRASVLVDLRILCWTPSRFSSEPVAVDARPARLTLRRRPTALSPETALAETLEAQDGGVLAMATTKLSRMQGHAIRHNGSRKDTTRAVVLAGGRGARLAPYTSVLPKPLMPIGTARF